MTSWCSPCAHHAIGLAMAAWLICSFPGVSRSSPASSTALQAPPRHRSRPEGTRYAVLVSDAAHRFGLAEDWIWAVMSAESAGHPRAVSPVGAMGLMQIMPSTWKDLSARFALGADPFDARANIMAGAAYLRLMLDRYGDIVDTLAAYNAGPRRVDDWRAGLRILPPETIAYVTRIAAALQTSGGSEAAAR